MAQSLEFKNYDKPRRGLVASNAAVAVVAGGNTTLLDIPCQGIDRIFVEVTPTTNGFDAFIIAGRCHPAAGYVTLYSAAGDYTTPRGLLVGASGDLTTLSAASTGWFVLDVKGIDSIRIQASGSGGTATTTIYAGGS